MAKLRSFLSSRSTRRLCFCWQQIL